MSMAITFIEVLFWGNMNCEHEGRNAEDPYTVARREGWRYRWPHPRTISCACRPRHGNAIQCIVTESIHLIAVGRAGVQCYVCTDLQHS